MANNYKPPFRERVAMFMSGRNGNDALNMVLWVLYVIVFVVSIFLQGTVKWILMGCEVLLLFLIFYRFFSRSPRRQQENRVVVSFFRRIGNAFRLQRHKWKDRKTHVYKKCPHCKQVLRLPRQKGDHTVACPCCKTSFPVKI
ncbi:MAG: hypothetical protein IJR83_01375 [Clostridia bacterium]|nr:hypothetical protein [Clostridia bacterium]